MADAFDRWIEWANNRPGQRPGLASDVHASVMSLDTQDRTDRQKVNAAVEHRAELRRTGRTAWIYLDDFDRGTRRTIGDPEWVKVFASAEAADRWFHKHDPEGVAWEYEIEGGPRQASVWIFLSAEGSREIGDPGWIKLFATERAAEKWLEQNAPTRQSWEYPVEE
ncbi:hypothetical protein JJB98_04045 [Bradyrhizobium diazoefficiens]|nr:hypothetical protein [Bradyrhizobium diazoefficiens]QQO19135.1 hypothetical protein JJB98_04045 [Bradyrhizobium diazoefficiens]